MPPKDDGIRSKLKMYGKKSSLFGPRQSDTAQFKWFKADLKKNTFFITFLFRSGKFDTSKRGQA
jgi:hypothetical protein